MCAQQHTRGPRRSRRRQLIDFYFRANRRRRLTVRVRQLAGVGADTGRRPRSEVSTCAVHVSGTGSTET